MEGIIQSICSPGRRQYIQPGILLAFEEKKCIIYTVITIKRQIAKFNLINPGPY